MNNMDFHRTGGGLMAAELPMVRVDRSDEVEVQPAQSTLLPYLMSVARRRWWIIVGALAICVVLGVIVTLLMTPRYTAVSTVEIQRETSNFINVQGAEEKTGPLDQEFYETQYGLLKAESLAQRVAINLRLQDNAQFFEMLAPRRSKEWFQDGRVLPGASTRADRIRTAGDALIDNIEVDPIRDSRLVEIKFTSPDAAFSKRLVDAWGTNFIQATLERRFEATSYARKFLEQRLEQLRTRIDSSERALVDYASRASIVNLPSGSNSTTGVVAPERSLVADDLASLNAELSQATADRIRAESRRSLTGGATTEGLSSTAIAGIRQRRAELAADYARLMAQFEPSYPPAIAIKSQIDQVDRSLATEESRVQRTLEQTYRASVEREQDLKARVASLKNGVLDFRRRSIQYNIFQRDVDTNRQLYDALLQRYKEIGVAGGVGVNNISIVDVAALPLRPTSPRLSINLALAIIMGLLLGVGGAFAMEQVEQGIVDPTEVEPSLNTPLLGTTPRSETDPIEALADRKSPLSEAYLSLLTNLAFSTDHGLPRTLAVTSSRPAEGKTTTSYALARSIARSKHRVLLVDADMRSPSMHKAIGVPNVNGLSNYLAGAEDLSEVIHRTDHDGLFLMTAGPQPPSAPELLSSDRLERLVSELVAQYDHVVFDAPPVMGLADAPLIGSRMEAVVFVVEAAETHKGMARVAINRLRAAHSHLVGAVLTKFDAKRAHYGYGYDYTYGYGDAKNADKQ